MKWKPTFEIEGVSLPLPDNYSQTIIDLSSDESGRSNDGKAYKDVIAVKTSVPLEWGRLEWGVAAALSNAVDGKTELTCRYIDVRKPYQMSTMKIYIGDRSFQPVQFDTDGKVFWSVSFSEIEE